VASRTGRRVRGFFRGLGQAFSAVLDARSGADGAGGRTQPDPALATLADLERLSLARLNQAEQIFEFEVLSGAAKSSAEALRFVDLLLGVLLAAQLVIVLLTPIGADPNAFVQLAVAAVAAGLACWGLFLTAWTNSSAVTREFLTDLAANPADARASATIQAAGIVKRNEERRNVKALIFAGAIALTLADCVWMSAARAQQAIAPPPVLASPSPAPTAAPTARPTAPPTARPARRNNPPQRQNRRPQAQRASAQPARKNNSR
jgi:hypothetical protein